MKRLIISFLLLLFGPLSQRSTLPVTIEFSDFESNDIVSYSFYIPRGFRHPRIGVVTEAAPNRWTHHVLVNSVDEIDDQLMGWLKQAARFSNDKQ